MKKSFKEIGGELLQAADKNSPAILTGLVCAGVLGTAILAWFNAPKAKDIIDQYKEDVADLESAYSKESPHHNVMSEIREVKSDADKKHNEVMQDFKEEKAARTTKMVGGVAKQVLPVVVMGGATIACAIGANTVSSKRIAALTAAYSISEKALTEYTQKVQEVLGAEKENKVQAAIAEKKVKENPPTDSTQVILTGKGDVLCYDTYSGRYFRSNAETIRQKVNDLNEQLMDEYYISLNEFYYMLGLPEVKLGNELGFCIDSGKLNMKFSTTLAEDNTPVLVLNYDISPKYSQNQRYSG